MEIQICRLCLKPTESNYLNIFKEQGIELNIASVLTHHFWFETRDDDTHSKRVCTPCWLQVESFHIFYMQVYNEHNKLIEKLNIDEIKTEVLTTASEILSEINENEVIRENSEILSANLDDNFTCDNDDNTEEIRSNQSSASETECSDDTATISLPYPLPHARRKQTMRSKRNSDEIEQIQREDNQIREYFLMECELCETKFERFYNVKSHYRIAHSLNGYLTCCSKKFFKRCYVLQHIQLHLNPDIFKCEVCDKTYLEKRGLQNHMNKHLPVTEKPYKCAKCPKAFAKNFLLKQHQIRHITEKDKHFFCIECGKSFASNSILQSHKRGVHEGAYIHVCEICAKSFKSKLFYETHMKSVHSNETIPKVQCQLCGTWLKHEHSLRSHMTRHEDANTNHICTICGKQSPNRGALRSHQQYVHMIGRTHKCSICDKAFKKAVALKEHMTIHTGEVLYKCPHCTKTFNSSANLHSHRKKVHPKEWEANRRSKIIKSCEKNPSSS